MDSRSRVLILQLLFRLNKLLAARAAAVLCGGLINTLMTSHSPPPPPPSPRLDICFHQSERRGVCVEKEAGSPAARNKGAWGGGVYQWSQMLWEVTRKIVPVNPHRKHLEEGSDVINLNIKHRNL